MAESLYTMKDRIASISNGTGGVITFDPYSVYSGHSAYDSPIYSFDFLGDSAVASNFDAIEYSANRWGIDPGGCGEAGYGDSA